MTFEKVKEIIVDTINCDESEITMDAKLKEDLNIDSLDSMELVMALEEAYGITIEESALGSFESVKNIVEYIDSHVASNHTRIKKENRLFVLQTPQIAFIM